MHELDPWDHHDPFDGSEQVNPFSEASADSDSEDIGATPDEAEAADRLGYPPEAGGTQPEHPLAEPAPSRFCRESETPTSRHGVALYSGGEAPDRG